MKTIRAAVRKSMIRHVPESIYADIHSNKDTNTMKKAKNHMPPVHNLGMKSPMHGRKFTPQATKGKKMSMPPGRSGVGKHRVMP